MSIEPKALTRSAFLRAAAGTFVVAATAGPLKSSWAAQPKTTSSPVPDSDGGADIDSLLRELDDRVQAGMQKYGIPGVALGLLLNGTGYIRGYGVTNVDSPQQVDGDTLFRIASTTKTFTGTTVMRLVEQGKLDLDATVRTYLPDFATSDPSVASRVTLRQLLNHSPGWLGDYLEGTGPGDDALARYVAGIAQLPQLTPLGEVFAYNNAAICLAGRLIEVVTGLTYEEAVRELVLDPLGMPRSRFSSDEEIPDFNSNVAAPHDIVDGEPVVDTSLWTLPRSQNPTGGLISSVREQLAYAAFHLGDGTAQDGTRLLSKESLVAMRSNPGPGGTLVVELDGMGVTWMLRPSAEGVRIVQHGGAHPGEHSGFIMVPERGFALTMLTNSDGGPQLLKELFYDDWALRRFAGVSNLQAESRALTQAELAPYEGRYTAQIIDESGTATGMEVELTGDNGRLNMTQKMSVEPDVLDDPTDIEETEENSSPAQEFSLAFYRDDYVLVYDESGEPTFSRANFIRGADGGVLWLRFRGRLFRHQGVSGGLPETGGPHSVGDLLGQLLRRLL